MAANEESSFEYAIVQIKEEALSDPEEAIPATTNNNYSENGYKKGSKPRRSTRTAGRPSVRNVKQEPNNNTLKTKASKWSTDAEAVSQYQCEHCHETFDSNSRLSRHKRQHRYENCPICAKKIQIDFLKYHIGQMHAGGKEPTVANLPYQCALCEKSFYYANHLQKHKQVHEKKSCPVCGESFRQSYLKYHMTRMHPTDAANPVKYRCSACKETFYDRNLLWAHQQKHKKVMCPVCNKTFRYDSMNMHIATVHPGDVSLPSDDPSYACDKCDRSFVYKKQLTKHQRCHQMEKCTICKKSFKRGYIKTHTMQKHGGNDTRN